LGFETWDLQFREAFRFGILREAMAISREQLNEDQIKLTL
jgi:hypothetical protein